MTKWKFAYILLVIIVLTNCIVYGSNYDITKDIAIEKALKASQELIIRNNLIQKLERDYNDAVIESRSIKDLLYMDERLWHLTHKNDKTFEENMEYQILKSLLSEPMTETDAFQLTLASEINADNIRYAINVNKAILSSTRNSIVFNIYQQFISLDKINGNIENQRSLIINLEKSFDTAEKKFKYGKISNNDLKLLSLQLNKEKVVLSRLLIQREIMVSTIQKYIGESNDKKYSAYKIEMPIINISARELSDYKEDAFSDRVDLANAIQYSELKKRKFEITKRNYYYETNINHINALIELNDAQNKLDNLYIDVEQQVLNAYELLLNQINLIESNRQNYEISELKYNEAQERYRLGLFTELQLSKANIEYIQSKTNYENAKKEGLLKKLSLDNICGLSLLN